MLRDKMLAVMDEVNSEVAERQELVHMIALALLSGSNLFILGAPGQAKSFAVNEFRKRITGAKQFERLLSKQTDEEALFGRLDLASLIPGAVPAQVLTGDNTYQSLKAQLAQAADDFRADPADKTAATQLHALTEQLHLFCQSLFKTGVFVCRSLSFQRQRDSVLFHDLIGRCQEIMGASDPKVSRCLINDFFDCFRAESRV